MTLRPSLVAFTPWTMLDDYLTMFDIVETNDLIDAIDPVQYAIRLLIPPGSALLNQPAQYGSIEKFVGPLDQGGFQYPWTHPDPRMDELHQDISSAVEDAAKAEEDPIETFYRLRDWKRKAFASSRRRRGSKRAEAGLLSAMEGWLIVASAAKFRISPDSESLSSVESIE
ncbi:MAG: hypothetical protein ABI945_03270 [Nitrospirales bacterium]